MLTYRHPTVEDIPRIDEWVKQDKDHVAKCDGSFFVLKPDAEGKVPKGIQCIEVKDEEGTVFFLKFTNALVVDTQFAPESEVSRERVRAALKHAFADFSVSTKKLGYHAMLFESASAHLVRLFRTFGFSRLFDFFKVNL